MNNKKTTLLEDFQEILDMAAGADGGLAAVYIMQLIRAWDEKDVEVPFIRQFAKLCRMMGCEEGRSMCGMGKTPEKEK